MWCSRSPARRFAPRACGSRRWLSAPACAIPTRCRNIDRASTPKRFASARSAICSTAPLPVLFLFDELLSGTNSKDRRIAAEGVVRTMLARRAIGMVTTHDLALTEIAAIFPGQVANVHLQDQVEDGKMQFDYKLRDGVITHSNALELMRMIGLDV